MRARILILALLSTIPAAAQTSILSLAARPASPPINVLAFGDSITLGVRPGVTVAQSYPRRLSARAWHVATINSGEGGDTTTDMVARIDDVLGRISHVSAVLIMAGMNDAAMNDGCASPRVEPRVSLATFEANLVTLIGKARTAGAVPILLTSTPLSEAYVCSGFEPYLSEDVNFMLEEFVAATIAVGAANDVHVVDLYAAFRARADWETLLLDGIHPNAAGLDFAAQVIADDVFLP